MYNYGDGLHLFYGSYEVIATKINKNFPANSDATKDLREALLDYLKEVYPNNTNEKAIAIPTEVKKPEPAVSNSADKSSTLSHSPITPKKVVIKPKSKQPDNLTPPKPPAIQAESKESENKTPEIKDEKSLTIKKLFTTLSPLHRYCIGGLIIIGLTLLWQHKNVRSWFIQ